MRTLKSKGGFTLVELIVVIAILAILAGVAIPVYNGYINKAQDAALITELDAIQTAAQAANATKGAITGVVVTSTGITVTADGFSDDYDADFALFYEKASDADEATETDANKTVGQFTFKTNMAPTFTKTYENGAAWTRNDGWAPYVPDTNPNP